MKIRRRCLPLDASPALLTDLPPLLQRVYAQRGIRHTQELDLTLTALLNPAGLTGLDQAVTLLFSLVQEQKKILVVGDFDADGATSTALAILGLRALGARQVSYLVPDRFKFGYGLTPAIVAEAEKSEPDLIMTVDNGISSVEGVQAAQKAGIRVLITDHHLAGETLPTADALVNPNQVGCGFASKNLAGVGVVFYLLLGLRARMRSQTWFEQQAIPEPNLADYLDLVALGTVADVVPLDQNNRILVHHGLQRIRAGRCRPGIAALLSLGKRDFKRCVASDLAFVVGPRLNAAGRLEDMSLGIECLLTQNAAQAARYAQQLDDLNQERRHIEDDMKEMALRSVQGICEQLQGQLPWGLALFDNSWHQGVVGLVAARIKEKYHRPVIAFAPAAEEAFASPMDTDEEGELKGSARSISGLHIRDALENLAKRHPGLIIKYGGHAMAAGLSIQKKNLTRFAQLFDEEVCRQLNAIEPLGELFSDGELGPDEMSLASAELLRGQGPWGQAFPEPHFDGCFELLEQRLLADKHLKLVLLSRSSKQSIEAIAFNVDRQLWPTDKKYLQALYRLDVNDFRDQKKLQLVIEAMQPLAQIESLE